MRMIAVATSVLTTAVVSAHHSFSAEFDLDKPIRLTGIVTKLEWTNPHAWFYVDIKDESGKAPRTYDIARDGRLFAIRTEQSP